MIATAQFGYAGTRTPELAFSMFDGNSEIERARRLALEGGDAVEFARLCDMMGIDRGDSGNPELFDQGVDWINYESSRYVDGSDRNVNSRYNILDAKRAEEIIWGIKGNGRNQKFMRSLVANVTGDGEFAEGLDYNGLRNETHKIRGVCEKLLLQSE